jgi:multicomponent Na+:H+ antiporter subunit F
VILVAAIMLVVAGVCFLARVIVGPSLADRVIAVDGLVITIVGGILLNSIRVGSSWFLDVAVVAAVVGFLGTAATARFIERRGG